MNYGIQTRVLGDLGMGNLSGKSEPRDQAVLLFYRTQSIRI